MKKSLLFLAISFFAFACAKKEKPSEQPAQAPSISDKLMGYWQVKSPAGEMNQEKFRIDRIRFVKNQYGIDLMYFCGSADTGEFNGVTMPKISDEQIETNIMTEAFNIKKAFEPKLYKATITILNENHLQFDGHMDYERFTPAQELAVDHETDALCKQTL